MVRTKPAGASGKEGLGKWPMFNALREETPSPNAKLQRNFKQQTSMAKVRSKESNWCLKIELWSLSGVWRLAFEVSPVLLDRFQILSFQQTKVAFPKTAQNQASNGDAHQASDADSQCLQQPPNVPVSALVQNDFQPAVLLSASKQVCVFDSQDLVGQPNACSQPV